MIFVLRKEKLSQPMRNLSNLKAIQAFESVARNGSYVMAARELHVTPAAVGQQVRALEARLGTPLFHRLDTGTNRLVPTEQAKLALVDFQTGFDRLDRGMKSLRATRNTLTISASQAFVAKWLMARLDTFATQYPAIELRLDVTDRLVDVAHDEADIAIRCGLGGWPDISVTLLMNEEVFPVCAPTLLSSEARSSLKDFRDYTLIHDATSKTTGLLPEWETWLRAAGMPLSNAKNGLQINSSAAVIQAAINGAGIALARRTFVADDLRQGLLVRLFPKIVFPIEAAYYLVYANAAGARPNVQAFCAWIKSVATAG